jgi:5'-nucleotidase
MATENQRIERVLLTNDDGVDAPGLQILEAAAASIASEVWVVAPEHDRSGTSHSISLHAPLRVHQIGPRRFSVSGTPGDCVVMAVRHLMADARPTLVLSGINRGANLGVETVFSGTVGAAMTALLLGLPAIALSQAFSDRNAVRWDTARMLAPRVIQQLWDKGWNANACLNVNFPDVAAEEAGPLTFTRQGAGLVRNIDVLPGVDPRGLTYFWLQFNRQPFEDAPESETSAVERGRVSVTPLQFERTNEAVYSDLALMGL